jgi:hypothetical protein
MRFNISVKHYFLKRRPHFASPKRRNCRTDAQLSTAALHSIFGLPFKNGNIKRLVEKPNQEQKQIQNPELEICVERQSSDSQQVRQVKS